MTKITINGFLGANLAFDDTLLPASVGVKSLNQRPGYGDLQPWEALSTVIRSVTSSPQQLTIYRMGQTAYTDNNYWLTWPTVVHVCTGFDATDTTERIYFTGSGTPKWTDTTKALTSGPPYPVATRELSVPAPTVAFTIAINTNPATGTDVAFSHVYTFVNELGWESAPSPVSNTILAKPGCTFDVTGGAAPPSGYGILSVRLYRYSAGATGSGDYFFVREWLLSAVPSNPIDDARAASTDPIATEGWRPPPTDGKCLTKMWNGMLAMISGKGVRICEPYKPYAYPLAYELALTHDGVAMAVIGQRLLVLTTGDAKVFVGSSPDAMDEEPTKINRPCTSSRGVVEFNEGADLKGVVWPSEEGLCWYGEGGFRLLTDGILTRDQWKDLVPDTMIASRVGRFYICFYNDGAKKGFVIDPAKSDGMYFLSTGYNAMYRDALIDRLYVLDAGNVCRWDDGGYTLTTTFKSKLFRMPRPENIGVIEVIAKTYPVTVTMWADGVQVYTGNITSDTPVRTSSGWRGEEIQFEVSATGRVISLRAASTIDELRTP